MFSIGIIGLPNVGKSTLFKALTKKQVDISNYPFCTIEPNVGIVAVPDEGLNQLAGILNPPKITPTIIEFVDIAGLVKNAHKGEGLGNQFLARIREVDLICQVVRTFESEKISHIDGTINPQRDIETVNSELIAKDLETIERRLEKTKKESKSGDKKEVEESEILEKTKNWLESQKMVREMEVPFEAKKTLSELSLLTSKPIIYIFNRSEDEPEKNKNIFSLDLKNEAELTDLSPEEIKELQLSASQLDQLIRICYDVLELITFYTIAGGKELRAWTLKKGGSAFEAAGLIHSDFQEKFIKAEVIDSKSLIEINSRLKEMELGHGAAWSGAKEQGKIKTAGKDYIMEDGDIIEFKI